jgi:hypothetical protein
LLPRHDCCDYCSEFCDCEIESCNNAKPYNTSQSNIQSSVDTLKVRCASEEDKRAVLESLKEIQETFISDTAGISAFGNSHGFSNELILDVGEHCNNIFTIEYIMTKLPVFSKNHAILILGIVDEIFGDVDEDELTGTTYYDNPVRSSGFEELLNCEYCDDVLEEPCNLDFLP